jgi:hypothetical protein
MPNYILAYHGGKIPESPEEGAEHMAKWEAWADGLGDSLINKGTPLGKPKTISSNGVTDGGGVNPLIGYSILKAENIDAAVKMVEDSPHVNYGGTMVVAEMMEMGSC